MNKVFIIGLLTTILLFPQYMFAQNNSTDRMALQPKDQSIIAISALTAKGDLVNLKPAINKGLESGLTINEIKEAIVHLYAYCGFPRSIRGLQTFMEVIDERKEKGLIDETGPDISPINNEASKYDRGKQILAELTKTPQDGKPAGYAAFAPVIEVFLKEHLFADIFERDILTYAQRELVTVSVISAIGGAEPMLRSHLNICLNVGLSPQQLKEFVDIIQCTLGDKEGHDARTVLNEVLKAKNLNTSAQEAACTRLDQTLLFPKGEKIKNSNFTGTAYLQMLVEADSQNNNSIGNVTFEPGARTKWHIHPAGQILLVTDGVGYVQEKGKPKRVVRKGDVVVFPPNVSHWHGASADSAFVQIAITGREKGETIWQEIVTDEEYRQ